MTKPIKYPKTFHANYSRLDPKGNDRVLENQDHFYGREVIVSTKLDGECTGMTRELCHARSLDSGDHPSRHWVKAKHAEVKHLIPKDYEIFGENVCGKHAIYYTHLPTYFFVFGIYNQDNVCLSWDDTKVLCDKLGIATVPILYRGIWDEEKVKSCYTGRTIINGIDCGIQEGMVCRVASSFHYDDFAMNCYKYVKPNFIPGDTEHWSKSSYLPNKLIK